MTGGTGKQAALEGYRVGGKSGTSQKLDSANEGARIASFVSVAPIDDPKIAVLICLVEPHSWTTSGGALSGPVCAEVLRKTLPYLGVEPGKRRLMANAHAKPRRHNLKNLLTFPKPVIY